MVSVSSKYTAKNSWDGSRDGKPSVFLMLGLMGLVQGGRGQLALLKPTLFS